MRVALDNSLLFSPFLSLLENGFGGGSEKLGKIILLSILHLGVKAKLLVLSKSYATRPKGAITSAQYKVDSFLNIF